MVSLQPLCSQDLNCNAGVKKTSCHAFTSAWVLVGLHSLVCCSLLSQRSRLGYHARTAGLFDQFYMETYSVWHLIEHWLECRPIVLLLPFQHAYPQPEVGQPRLIITLHSVILCRLLKFHTRGSLRSSLCGVQGQSDLGHFWLPLHVLCALIVKANFKGNAPLLLSIEFDGSTLELRFEVK